MCPTCTVRKWLHGQSSTLCLYLALLDAVNLAVNADKDRECLLSRGKYFRIETLPTSLVVSSASMYTTMGKLLIELCGIAVSSENCCFPLRECGIIDKRMQAH